MQRALLQYFDSKNHALVRVALQKAGRADLIGGGAACLVPGNRPQLQKNNVQQSKSRQDKSVKRQSGTGQNKGKKIREQRNPGKKPKNKR